MPDDAFKLALDRLRNYVSYGARAVERRRSGARLCALCAGAKRRAPIGDLRYLADAKIDDLKTPTAKARSRAALAMLGDRTAPRRCSTWRSTALPKDPEFQIGRTDYGSPLRDAAAVVTLAAEGERRSRS